MTDAEIIVALGDTGAVAKELGLSDSRVSNWKTRGIPWRYRGTVSALAKRRRIAIPDNFMALA